MSTEDMTYACARTPLKCSLSMSSERGALVGERAGVEGRLFGWSAGAEWEKEREPQEVVEPLKARVRERRQV